MTKSKLVYALISALTLAGACGDDDAPNTKPVAEAGNAATVEKDTELALDGSKSDDEDGDELTYKWTVKKKPEGSTATLTKDTDQKPKFKGSAAGTYDIELVVKDGTDESTPDTVTITVTDTAE
jgi:hypothetical protein